MRKFRKAQCPYCGRKVSLISSWFLKTQGEYQCPKCGAFSNIQLDGTVAFFAVITVFLSAVIIAVQMLLIQQFNFIVLILFIIPYVLFYAFSVFLIRLQKPVSKKKPPTQRPRPTRPPGTYNSQNDMEHTTVMNKLK